MNEFFTKIQPYLLTYNLRMTISQNGDQIAVALTPVPKSDLDKVSDKPFPAMVFTGTAAELDAELVNKLLTPLSKTEGIVSNISMYAAQMKKKEEEAKAKTEAKKTVDAKKAGAAIGAAKKPEPAGLFAEDINEEEQE